MFVWNWTTIVIKPTLITKHRISRGLGGKNAVQYFTNWDEVSVKTWEHETDLEQYGNLVSRYWAGDPIQVGGENAKYRRYSCLLYTSPSPRDLSTSRMPSSA